MLVQRLNRRKTSWDKPIDPEEKNLFLEEFATDIRGLGSIEFRKDLARNGRWHMFSNASRLGSDVVVYGRWSAGDGIDDVKIPPARARVALLKSKTIPHPKSSAAVLVVKMAHTVRDVSNPPTELRRLGRIKRGDSLHPHR